LLDERNQYWFGSIFKFAHPAVIAQRADTAFDEAARCEDPLLRNLTARVERLVLSGDFHLVEQPLWNCVLLGPLVWLLIAKDAYARH
jgi:hypothetical protein